MIRCLWDLLSEQDRGEVAAAAVVVARVLSEHDARMTRRDLLPPERPRDIYGSAISCVGWSWSCRCGAERPELDYHNGDAAVAEAEAHNVEAVLDAVWPLAAESGYRRAVQALRDHDRFFGWLNANPRKGFMAAPSSAADYLEALAALDAAPRNEGAQT